jgi:hypothetical protein
VQCVFVTAAHLNMLEASGLYEINRAYRGSSRGSSGGRPSRASTDLEACELQGVLQEEITHGMSKPRNGNQPCSSLQSAPSCDVMSCDHLTTLVRLSDFARYYSKWQQRSLFCSSLPEHRQQQLSLIVLAEDMSSSSSPSSFISIGRMMSLSTLIEVICRAFKSSDPS